MADIEEAIRVLHDYGIRSHGMFVLGADDDTEDSVRETVEFALRNQIDTVMLNILTPLPGTQQFADLDAEGRILERYWSFYDAQHIVFRPRHMSPSHLLRETLRANRRFYHAWRVLRSVGVVLWRRDRPSWDRMLERGWLWWYARMWWRDPANRAYRRRLQGIVPAQPAPAAQLVSRA